MRRRLNCGNPASGVPFRVVKGQGTICAECENAFWGSEVHVRQLMPNGKAFQDGNAEALGVPNNWTVVLGLASGVPGEFWISIYDELSYIKRRFC